jgi:hypothetical protein
MTPEGTYSQLTIPGFHQTREVGEPALPARNRLFRIPLGASVEVEVESFDTEVVNLADHGIVQPLMPAQPSVSKSDDPATLPFHVDQALYARDADYGRELVRTVDTGWMRGLRVGRVEVAPVSYNPVQGTLTLHRNVRFTLHFPGADLAADEAEMRRTYSPFFEVVYNRIAGYESLQHDTHPDLVVGPVKYVIVADRMFEAQLEPFIAWKTMQGFEVVEAFTDQIGGSTTAIRTYLHGLYDAGTPDDPPPTFVLFVGDTAQIPAFNSSGATDRPYCDVSDDLAPEMYYGRFSARTTAELQPQIDKTLEYEQHLMPNPLYLAEVVMIAGVDSYNAPTYGNGQINYGTTQYFNTAHNILSHTYLYPASESSGPQIIQDVSNGVAYVNYTAHGSQTSWSNPSFTRTHIDNLQNEHEYCLAVGNCCLTSSFDYGDCFAEHWLRAANKGAIGYIGGANNTYWDEDYWWGVGYGPVIGHGPTYEQTGLGAYDGVFHDHGEDIDNWYVVQDAIVFCGNLAVQEAGSSLITYYWNIYNLMGDPSLNPHIGVVLPNPVTHDAAVPAEGTGGTFTVTATPNSYIGLTKDGALIGCGLVGMDGTVAIGCEGQGTTGTAHLVVTCHNMEPFEADMPIGGTTAIGDADGGAVAAVRLEGNAPNPFNPRTTFRMTLPSEQAVTLVIHDIQGRSVRTLVDGVLPAGEQRVEWDGRDDAGNALASGLYIARFESAGVTDSWKVVLAR